MGGGGANLSKFYNFTDAVCEKLGTSKIQIERAHRVGEKERGTERPIVAKCSSCKGEQNVLNEARHQKIEDIYVYEEFSKATMAIRKENWEKVKALALRQQGNYAILVYGKSHSREKL